MRPPARSQGEQGRTDVQAVGEGGGWHLKLSGMAWIAAATAVFFFPHISPAFHCTSGGLPIKTHSSSLVIAGRLEQRGLPLTGWRVSVWFWDWTAGSAAISRTDPETSPLSNFSLHAQKIGHLEHLMTQIKEVAKPSLVIIEYWVPAQIHQGGSF